MEEVNANNKDKKENKEPGRKEKTGDAIKRLKKGGTDLSLRILAFTIAVIVWFILSITQYPTVTKTIKDIRVEFNMAGTAAEEKGLEALNYKDITVDVEIKGMNYEIGNYDANDLIATVNLDSVTKEGKYMLDIDVRSVHTTDRCTVVSVTPETHEVEFDRITQKTLQVTAEAPLITAEDGYTLKDKTVSPAEITVEGPKKDLDKISSVSARISKSKKISEDTDMAADDLVFYDEDDAKADTSKFTVIGSSDYTVEFQVYKKKTINLNVGITGAPQDFDISSLPMSLSEDSISVITPHL
ncbi:MAG: hypothetical protein IJ806_11485, partial [Ruminococcus sp.]|nr:hypothetical protein [Ruminococcus sp.]